MFCANCGTEMEKGKFCPNCGWSDKHVINDASVPTPNVENYFEDNQYDPYADQYTENKANTYQNTYADAYAGGYAPYAGQYTENNDNAYQNAYENTASDMYANNYQYEQYPPTMPVGAPVQDFSAAMPKPKKKAWKVVVAILVVIALIGTGVFGVFYYRYTEEQKYLNSDGYKTEQAVGLIAAGQYDEGLNMIYDVYTQQADAIRAYVYVDKAKVSFVNVLDDKSSSVNDELAALSALRDALDKFDNESDISLLPEAFRNNYECYRAAVDFAYSDMIREINDYIYDVQIVMLNEVIANQTSKGGRSFTLYDYREKINTSKEALEKLDKYNFSSFELSENSKAATYCNFAEIQKNGKTVKVVYISSKLSGIMGTLISECKEEISNNQSHLDKSLEQFDLFDDLYRTNPKPDYSSYVGDQLDKIRTTSDISNNCEKIIKMLRCDLAYYLITGQRHS